MRETSKHNSDNALLESFGRELALQYKFKPLLVDGVPQQMELPLVLHFTAPQGAALPELDDTATRKRVTGCELPHEIADHASVGQQLTITFRIVENGKISTVGSSDRKIPVMSLFRQFQSCHFGVFLEDGKAGPYDAKIVVTAR